MRRICVAIGWLCECRIHIKNVAEQPEVVLDGVFGRRRLPTFRKIALPIWDHPIPVLDLSLPIGVVIRYLASYQITFE